MSFYINEFRQHLQGLSDKVEKPYDEPASRQKNYGSIEEAYQTMKQPRGFQRPAPTTQLNEWAGIRPGLELKKRGVGGNRNSSNGWYDAQGNWHPRNARNAGGRSISNRGKKQRKREMAPPLTRGPKNIYTGARQPGRPGGFGGGGVG
tara:strand:+ start:2053 stop:2496 length:444 start_codon:yes stop_codon:yes gene_type:complete